MWNSASVTRGLCFQFQLRKLVIKKAITASTQCFSQNSDSLHPASCLLPKTNSLDCHEGNKDLMTMKGPWFGLPSRASSHIDCWVVKWLEQTVLVWAAKRLLTAGSNVSVWVEAFRKLLSRQDQVSCCHPYHYYPVSFCSLSLVGRVIFIFTRRWTTIHRRTKFNTDVSKRFWWCLIWRHSEFSNLRFSCLTQCFLCFSGTDNKSAMKRFV